MSTLTSIGQNVRGKPLLADIKNPFIDKVMNGLKATVRKDGSIKMITVTSQDDVTVIIDESEQKALIIMQENKLEEELASVGFSKVKTPLTGEGFEELPEGRYVDGIDTCQLQACIVETMRHMGVDDWKKQGFPLGLRMMVAYRHNYELTEKLQKLITRCLHKLDGKL